MKSCGYTFCLISDRPAESGLSQVVPSRENTAVAFSLQRSAVVKALAAKKKSAAKNASAKKMSKSAAKKAGAAAKKATPKSAVSVAAEKKPAAKKGAPTGRCKEGCKEEGGANLNQQHRR